MTKSEAYKIAERIRNHWAEMGCAVQAWTEKEPYVEGVNEAGYTVRTDMVNGLPRNAPRTTVNEIERRMRL